ncbi:MAG: T9SS type A sorting domain-containing protein, partial [Bacteroidia bacterium]
VKAVKIITSGCGQFIHSSIGKDIQGTLILGLQEEASAPFVNVFPNPTSDLITVQSSQKMIQIELFTITGQRVYASEIEEETTTQLNMTAFAPQVYVMRITSKKGRTSHVRILKTE